MGLAIANGGDDLREGSSVEGKAGQKSDGEDTADHFESGIRLRWFEMGKMSEMDMRQGSLQRMCEDI